MATCNFLGGGGDFQGGFAPWPPLATGLEGWGQRERRHTSVPKLLSDRIGYHYELKMSFSYQSYHICICKSTISYDMKISFGTAVRVNMYYFCSYASLKDTKQLPLYTFYLRNRIT